MERWVHTRIDRVLIEWQAATTADFLLLAGLIVVTAWCLRYATTR